MASQFSHAVAALSIGRCFYHSDTPKRIWAIGTLCSVIPDIDVVGFRFGIRYGDFWGHRGFTHSLVFAALLAGAIVALGFSSPFDSHRYFLPWTPIRVSPMGAGRFFSDRGLAVLQSELVWIWAPAALLAASAWVLRRRGSAMET